MSKIEKNKELSYKYSFPKYGSKELKRFLSRKCLPFEDQEGWVWGICFSLYDLKHLAFDAMNMFN